MTGEKNRFKPLDKMAGLNDKQLTTPKHDEMVLWLLNKENIKSTFSNEIKKVNNRLLEEKNDLINKIHEIEKDPELYNRNRDDSWDPNAEDKIKQYQRNLDGYFEEVSIKLISEAPVVSKYNNFIIGYWDLVIELDIITPDWKKWLKGNFHGNPNPIQTLYVEVKPKVESFGETMRQLRTYQQYISNYDKENIYLFTTDSPFKDAFESQGIKVILPSDLI